MVDASFYRAFEDRYRGSRELIKSRLTVYLPFILPFKQFEVDFQGLDLGCGRGEWLELMQENGVEVQGIDLDEGMLEAARERGLNAIHGDAMQMLQSLVSESKTVISGFHIAEHLPFELLQTMIQESLRVLKPGGLLILETPNPENIVVGTCNFYLDPTHKRPIPSQLLSFMVEYAGFEKVKILRLQDPAGLAENNELNLLSVLNGVGPDYAVVAQKEGAPEIDAAIAGSFDVDYGFSLGSLANSYDQQIKDKARQTEAKARQAEAKAQQAEAVSIQLSQQANEWHERILALHSSTSWKITAPIRVIGRSAKRWINNIIKVKARVKGIINGLPNHAILYINRRPAFKRAAFAVLSRFPALANRVRQARMGMSYGSTTRHPVAIELANLTPRARAIYAGLKAAIENHKKGSN